MTELEIFAKFTLEKGDEWWELEKCNNGGLYESKGHYIENYRDYYTSPVFQVFNKDGKRIMTSMNYLEAIKYYENNIKE